MDARTAIVEQVCRSCLLLDEKDFDGYLALCDDGFHYEITVDGKTVYTADPRLTDEQRTLISRVLKEGA